jgi:hypothetical protein
LLYIGSVQKGRVHSFQEVGGRQDDHLARLGEQGSQGS